jgi:hypothetical protein
VSIASASAEEQLVFYFQFPRDGALLIEEDPARSEFDRRSGCSEAETMPTVYRLVAPDGGAIGDADSVDGIVEIATKVAPGRYRIDQVKEDPGTAGGLSRAWGNLIKTPTGRVKLDVPPWLD